MKKRGKRFISLLVFVLLIVTIIPLPQSALASNVPYPVVGKTLVPAKSGDNVNWNEIARYGNYSLIMRSHYVNWYTGKGYYNNDKWQYMPYGTSTAYCTSRVYSVTNAWFNGTNSANGDNLSMNARLRKFTVENNSRCVLGTAGDEQGKTNGYSLPYNCKRSCGNDVAFALSYGEAVAFVSDISYTWQNGVRDSCAIASCNFKRFYWPPVPGAATNAAGAWLRSPGFTSYCMVTAGALQITGGGRGYAFQSYAVCQDDGKERGYVYPALWVETAIFDDDPPPTCTVTYYPNGVVGSEITVNVPNGSSYVIAHQGYGNPPGGTFTYTYNTMPDGSGTTYYVGQSYAITSNLNLYAQWLRTGAKVSGYVAPMVTNSIVPGFLGLHDIVVELRATFKTPAAAGLSTKAVQVTTSGIGQFTFEGVPYGNYVLYISRPGYLVRAMNVTVSPGSQTVFFSPPGTEDGGVFNLWYGDCNGDKRVDNEDVLMIIRLMDLGVVAGDPKYNAACDLNADGLINNTDIMMAFNNWNKDISMYPGAGDVNVNQ